MNHYSEVCPILLDMVVMISDKFFLINYIIGPAINKAGMSCSPRYYGDLQRAQSIYSVGIWQFCPSQ